MKTFKYFLFLSIVTTITIYSCKKDDLLDHPNNLLALEGAYPPIISGNGNYDEETESTPTILGAVRTNPYSVEVMTQAWNMLYPNNQVGSLTPTHLYIKFSPNNADELKLIDQTGEMLYDYPLENEMIQLGDYYPQPGKDIPDYWAVVCPGFQSPISGYQIISQLVIPPYESILTKTAFDLTSNIWSTPEDPITTPLQINCAPGTPDFPNCLNALNKHYGDGQNGDGDPCYPLVGGGGDIINNACGCPVYSDQRKPGGCVKVKDVEKNIFEGVRRVKIIMKDTWFTEDETFTDDQGCWKIGERYHGKAWMWIKFSNDKCQIRGTKAGLNVLNGWIDPVKDYLGKIRSGPPYNNIEVRYDIWQNQGSQAHVHWGAATVNNALHEFHDYSPVEGINTPPTVLDIYIGRNNDYGYAIMSSQYLISNTAFSLLLLSTRFVSPFDPLLILVGNNALRRYLPDVYIGINFKSSDRLKLLAYHEIAHASHWTKAGTSFWNDLVITEIINNGHGNSGSSGAGLSAIAESWAEHVALTYTHNTYGGSNTAYWPPSWAFTRERVRNEVASHIPIGLYNDLIDGNDEEFVQDYSGGTGTIVDWVNGFTNAQMFNLLTESTTSPVIFRDKFIQAYANGNQQLINQINGLFAGY